MVFVSERPISSVLSYAHQIPHAIIATKNINVQNIDPKIKFQSTKIKMGRLPRESDCTFVGSSSKNTDNKSGSKCLNIIPTQFIFFISKRTSLPVFYGPDPVYPRTESDAPDGPWIPNHYLEKDLHQSLLNILIIEDFVF